MGVLFYGIAIPEPGVADVGDYWLSPLTGWYRFDREDPDETPDWVYVPRDKVVPDLKFAGQSVPKEAEAVARNYSKGLEAIVSPPVPPASDDPLVRLAKVCTDFIRDNRVTCPEATTNDRVYEHAPELVEKIGDILGYHKAAD